MQTCFSYRTLFYIWHIIEYWCAPSVFLIFLVCFVLLRVGSVRTHDQRMKLQIQLRTLIQHVFCYILQYSFESIVGPQSVLTHAVKWSCASVTLCLAVWFNYKVHIYISPYRAVLLQASYQHIMCTFTKSLRMRLYWFPLLHRFCHIHNL